MGFGGLVISGQRNFFFCKPAGQDIFFPSNLSTGFFSSKRVSPSFVKMYLHLHCGYCSNVVLIWSCRA